MIFVPCGIIAAIFASQTPHRPWGIAAGAVLLCGCVGQLLVSARRERMASTRGKR